jgi:hypothetical protein
MAVDVPIWWPERIVSGGQTGVDRAALDVAMLLGIPHGGWCPKGRIAEDGLIHPRYQLQELDSAQYSDRTRRNVQDSDGTLILYTGELQGGTLLTLRYVHQQKKPSRKILLTHPGRRDRIREWIEKYGIRKLNIAGPRASKFPEIYEHTVAFLCDLFQS